MRHLALTVECGDCKWWGEPERHYPKHRKCNAINNPGPVPDEDRLIISADPFVEILTQAEYGCVQFEARDAKSIHRHNA